MVTQGKHDSTESMLPFQGTMRLLEKKKQRKRRRWLSHILQKVRRRVPRRRRSLLSPITALQKLLLRPPIRR